MSGLMLTTAGPLPGGLEPAGGGAWTQRAKAEQSERRALDIARTRLMVGVLVFAACFLAVAVRLVDLAGVEAWRVAHAAEEAGPREVIAAGPPARADIVDRNGVLLATTLQTASLYANPRIMLDKEAAAERLSTVLPKREAAELLALFQNDRAFVWVERHLPPRLVSRINALGIPGIDFMREPRRVYPQGPLLAHAVGSTDVDNKGLAGAERAFNDALVAADAEPLRLALDVRVQHAMRQELLDTMAAYSAKAAAGVVLNAKTGEVVALVSLPDFDPHAIGRADVEQQFNRVTLGVYELGSVFKAFTVAQALDRGFVTMADGYDASKPIRIRGGHVINDFRGQGRWLSVPEIFKYSSNIGTAYMALDIGAERQRAFLEDLGLGRRAGIELREVGRPLMPGVWRESTIMTVAFGHGLSVSPLQLTSAMAAMVNGGVLHRATILPHEGAMASGTRVISAETSDHMRRLMRIVVRTGGTATKADAPGYAVGGKTGTAEKAIDGRYVQDRLLTSFVGAFPIDDPAYVVYAVIDEPQGTDATFGFRTAGWNAAPAVGRVIGRIAPILGIAPSADGDARVDAALGLVDEDDEA